MLEPLPPRAADSSLAHVDNDPQLWSTPTLPAWATSEAHHQLDPQQLDVARLQLQQQQDEERERGIQHLNNTPAAVQGMAAWLEASSPTPEQKPAWRHASVAVPAESSQPLQQPLTPGLHAASGNDGPRLKTQRSRLQRQPGEPLAPQLKPLPLPDSMQMSADKEARRLGLNAAPRQPQQARILPEENGSSHSQLDAAVSPVENGSRASSSTTSHPNPNGNGNGSYGNGNSSSNVNDDSSLSASSRGSQGSFGNGQNNICQSKPRPPEQKPLLQNPIPLKPVEATGVWFWPSGTFKRKEL